MRYTDPTGHRNCEEDGYNCPGDKINRRPTYNDPDYSDWFSRNYGGCFKCHAGVANGQVALTNAQLAEAYSNITTWQAIGYTPIVGTAAVFGAPSLGPSIYNAAGVTCLSSPICVTLTGAAGGAGATNLPARNLYYSQKGVSSSTKGGIFLDDFSQEVAQGWKGDPLRVLRIGDQLVSLDNRRLVVAKMLDINVPVTISEGYTLNDLITQFSRDGIFSQIPIRGTDMVIDMFGKIGGQ